MFIPIDGTSKIKIKNIAVDTNILLWTFYGKTTYVQSYQKKIYPSFLAKLIQDKSCKIYTTTLNIAELYNVIEKNEYELYLDRNKLKENEFTRKQYRKIQAERKMIKEELDLIYNQVKKCMNISEYVISNETLLEFQNDYDNHKYDMNDFSLIKFCLDNDIKNILTDDKDFNSNLKMLNSINIYSANKNISKV